MENCPEEKMLWKFESVSTSNLESRKPVWKRQGRVTCSGRTQQDFRLIHPTDPRMGFPHQICRLSDLCRGGFSGRTREPVESSCFNELPLILTNMEYFVHFVFIFLMWKWHWKRKCPSSASFAVGLSNTGNYPYEPCSGFEKTGEDIINTSRELR